MQVQSSAAVTMLRLLVLAPALLLAAASGLRTVASDPHSSAVYAGGSASAVKLPYQVRSHAVCTLPLLLRCHTALKPEI